MASVEHYVAEAAQADARIVCFPESFVPGYRGEGFEVKPHNPAGLAAARDEACQLAARHALSIILTMDWDSPAGILNAAFVISPDDGISGVQFKNLLAPSEDATFAPADGRMMFEVDGVPFGISICIEGWRYPETVRWAARRGARIVFHPTLTGNNDAPVANASHPAWCAPDGPYYEKALVCRAVENGIYFASVNYALEAPEAATAVVDPEGRCVDRLQHGEDGLLVTTIDPEAAHRLYAKRLR